MPLRNGGDVKNLVFYVAARIVELSRGPAFAISVTASQEGRRLVPQWTGFPAKRGANSGAAAP
jgi:hypothetical protein